MRESTVFFLFFATALVSWLQCIFQFLNILCYWMHETQTMNEIKQIPQANIKHHFRFVWLFYYLYSLLWNSEKIFFINVIEADSEYIFVIHFMLFIKFISLCFYRSIAILPLFMKYLCWKPSLHDSLFHLVHISLQSWIYIQN